MSDSVFLELSSLTLAQIDPAQTWHVIGPVGTHTLASDAFKLMKAHCESVFPNQDALPSNFLGIVPLGQRGNLLWSRLPLPIASIVAECSAESVLVVPTKYLIELLDSSKGMAGRLDLNAASIIWQSVFEQSSAVHVSPALMTNGGSETLPELVCSRARIAPHLLDRLQKFPKQKTAEIALLAGLYHILDDMDVSHELAQSIEWVGDLKLGDYWHAIIHRREPDLSNARYWFRHIGDHPVSRELKKILPEIISDDPCQDVKRLVKSNIKSWTGLHFLEHFESALKNREQQLKSAVRNVQWVEMLLLLECCVRHGGASSMQVG